MTVGHGTSRFTRARRKQSLFARGRSDGFSPEDVALFLTIIGEVCTAVAASQFINVPRLSRDCAQGRCAPAFPPRLPAPLRNNAS
jgi:hypothetical protein